jgi:predicted DNA binding CopG/RHH family protein
MKEITPLKSEHLSTLRLLDQELAKIIDKAKDSGVPQGLIVSLLHAHSTKQTIEMIG